MSGAALYLRLLGQGLRLRLVEHPADLTGYRVRVAGLEALPATDQEEARQLIREHKPALVAFMRSGAAAHLPPWPCGKRPPTTAPNAAKGRRHE